MYSYPCSIHVDPIEKKPFFHFLPGTKTLSLATVGCNLHCKNCQNWEISQANPEDSEAFFCPPENLVELAKTNQCTSLAYTYTDPVIYYEYTLDSSKLARATGIRNILVTAGYINKEPWKELLQYIDAARIDLKSISDDFYREVCSATLKPVLDCLVLTKASGVHLEVINLVIPTLNDKPQQIRALAQWVKVNLGSDTPLHFSQFYPQYKMQYLPPTSAETLDTARQIAMSEGMQYVYIGNTPGHKRNSTFCAHCGEMLISRTHFAVIEVNLDHGKCPACGQVIPGIWWD